MKYGSNQRILVAAAVLACAPLHAGLWSTGYYAGWMQDHLPAAELDFEALTHVVHFAVVPNADGSLDSGINLVTPAHSQAVVQRARATGTKALVSVGGANSAPGFRGACSAANLPGFIAALTTFARERGYDGVDLDWEPLAATDAVLFTNLVNGLRQAWAGVTPRPILSAAAASQPGLFAELQDQFDQINLMTYDLAGPWPGWVTWFNAPVRNGGHRFPSTGAELPSAEKMLAGFVNAGISPAKLGIGIDCYGRVWSGGAGTATGGAALPRQSWTSAPGMTYLAFHQIMATYYRPERYSWDAAAHAAYLSIDQPGSADDKFITFDDPAACRAKVEFAAHRGLGGVMIFELGGGYRPGEPAGRRDPLLQAVKEAVREQFRITRFLNGEAGVQISFRSVAGQAYRVESGTSLAGPDWTSVARVTATGQATEVTVPPAPDQSRRFFRVAEDRDPPP
jgi:chitinase